MTQFPVALKVENRRVLVVGGGQVASRKVAALLEAGALVRVVSPDLSPGFPSSVEHLARRFEAGDCAGYFLVFAATNAREVNRQIADEARSMNILVNDASDAQSSDFHTQAIIRRGPLTVGISTSGLSPVVSAHLKRVVEEAIGPEWEQLFALVQEVGEPETARRGEFWRAVLKGDALELLREGKRDEARDEVKINSAGGKNE